MSALIHSPFECGALTGWLQVLPLPEPRLTDARSIWSNCRRLRHTSSPTVPEMSIFSLTIGMKVPTHKTAKIAGLIPPTDPDHQPRGLAARVFPFVTLFLAGPQSDRQVYNLSWEVR